ncbi:AraC family transcriptional regulator [Leptospira ilyithenensis]|uniref:AraC family transcriptional regulator n=1 Tax=Leptospira ilyithenensis TaxID=2484901 RepID=A0A4R9LRF5_9LEPT|nr:AraC family transcriptional regulator [Leptospira ilyithenensis]TGN13388.1 AraC family transcriptional regulator [Leptospira ilyithenensis]
MPLNQYENNRLRLAELLDPLVPEVGVISSAIKGIQLFRFEDSSPREPKAYEPGIIILVQGKKRVFLGGETYTYDPLNYLVLSIPLPIECETFGSQDEPILGLNVMIDPIIVTEILMQVKEMTLKENDLPKGIYSAPLSDSLAGTVHRLLEILSSPNDCCILGPMILRELIYRILCEDHHGGLRALAYRNRNFFKVARALNKIHESSDAGMDLKSLALDAGMSVSSFHSCFKAITNTPPIQYVKNMKLHKARILITQQGMNVYNAALKVGYESPSQFSREYKRLFGITPGKDSTSMGGAAVSYSADRNSSIYT